MGSPFEVLAVRESKHTIEVRHCSLIGRATIEADPWVATSELAADPVRIVVGAVVRNDELEVLESLVQVGLDSSAQRLRAVIDRQTYRKKK